MPANLVPHLRATLSQGSPPPTPAAVLIALTPTPQGEHVILAKRAEHLRLHAGEIAFPGGKREPTDQSVWDTALREAWEETALEPASVERLGILQPLVTRTGIELTPCVGRLLVAADLQPNPEELALLFAAPLAFFADKSNVTFQQFEYRGRQRQVPSYQWQQHRIWGVTAAMLAMLANHALDAGIALESYWRGSSDRL
ncbi:MAG: CoA pyrophosphatase [Pseudomonadota bacterium]